MRYVKLWNFWYDKRAQLTSILVWKLIKMTRHKLSTDRHRRCQSILHFAFMEMFEILIVNCTNCEIQCTYQSSHAIMLKLATIEILRASRHYGWYEQCINHLLCFYAFWTKRQWRRFDATIRQHGFTTIGHVHDGLAFSNRHN